MANKDRKKDKALRQAVDFRFKALSREEELAIFLETERERFCLDPSNALPAFRGVQKIAAWEWGREDGLERIPTATVGVPWWIVQAFAIGFHRYVDARRNGIAISLGEAFGLEGGGQGKTPAVTKAENELRDQRIAMGIALRIKRGMRVRNAIEEVLAEMGLSLSVDYVEKIWAVHGPQARAIEYK